MNEDYYSDKDRDRDEDVGGGRAWSSSYMKSNSSSTTPRSRQSSPRSPFASSPGQFVANSGHLFSNSGHFFTSSGGHFGKSSSSSSSRFASLNSRHGRDLGRRRHRGLFRFATRHWFLVVCVPLIVFNWWLFSVRLFSGHNDVSIEPTIKGEWSRYSKGKRPPRVMYDRLLALAAHTLAEGENKPEPQDLWAEPFLEASAWKPCANEPISKLIEHKYVQGNAGYILISANGGLNQQRVAICNGVAVARLLNATLVLPRFLYSSVWKDSSQFKDIYDEDYFINYLKDDVSIVKELPRELQSLDMEAIGSLVTDADIMKESKPSFYIKSILPILLKNGVVHFLGFGNRLAFDPIPFEIQRLRCKCNFHALKFVPKIQNAGALLVTRMHRRLKKWGSLEQNLIGESLKSLQKQHMNIQDASKYLALHLRFEIDMAAYSMCEFGGGEAERIELQEYRDIHFPNLTIDKKGIKIPSPEVLRALGRCPLTPEEAVLMLAALGFKRGTHIYLAGAHIYGGQSRMVALTSLYPNLVTKEDLLSYEEILPFRNFSSQMAALDFIGCAAADGFAMTDSGSQLSSLVSGYRIYYGGGQLPTIRPNKKRLASIFSENSSIEWNAFEERVRKAVRESKRIQIRPVARSVYRHPRCSDCMCHKSQLG